MSNKRYLEISSSYRNRADYPIPSTFTVMISQSGTRGAVNAYDPVSNAAPLRTWSPADVINQTGAIVLPGGPNTQEMFIVGYTTGDRSKESGYYTGLNVYADNTPGISEIRTIIGWDYTSTDGVNEYFTVIVAPPFSVVPTGLMIFVDNTTPTVAGSTNLNTGTIFVPGGLFTGEFFKDLIIYNQDLAIPESRQVISYDGTNRVAGIETPLVGWDTSHTLTLRKSKPQEIGVLPDPSLLLPPNPANTTSIFTMPTNTTVSVGDFIRFTGVTPGNINQSRRVVKYTGLGDLGATPPIYPYRVTVSGSFPSIPAIGDSYEVLQFTRDNAVPFDYTGSLISQQEMVCYEIELVTLVLPNKNLKSGGRIAFYPYVYVELQNVSGSSSGTYSAIYSNNPNAKRMLFRVSIDNISNPLISPFIKTSGDGMVQTVKFKPNDNLKFGVYLPNGELFETVRDDTQSPIEPDPLVQISALFSMRRL